LLNVLKNDDSLDNANGDTPFTLTSHTERVSMLLNQKLVSSRIKQNHFEQLNKLLIGYDTNWSSLDLLRRVQTSLDQAQSYTSTFKSVIRAFEWFHDQTFADLKALTGAKTSRQVSVTQLEELLSKLDTNNSSLALMIEKLNVYEQNSILKRLEWAAASNPSLNDAIRSFETKRKTRTEFFELEQSVFVELQSLVDAWLDFENMRTKSSVLYTSLLQSFESLVTTVESLGMLDEAAMPKISEVELTLVNFQGFRDRKPPLTTQIIQEYYKLVYDDVAQMKKHKQREEKEYLGRMEEVSKSCSELKTILNQHNKIMSDIKPLLKTMSKYSDNNQSIISYSKIYQSFSENCQSLVRCLSSVASPASASAFECNLMSPDVLGEIRDKLDVLVELAPKVYDDLLGIKEVSEKKQNQPQSSSLVEMISKSSSSAAAAVVTTTGSKALQPQPVTTTAAVCAQVKSGKVMQECNSYAIGVWKKIYLKLDGKETSTTERLSIQEQVELFLNFFLSNHFS
jgi:PI-3-kinase-related kinase SMG-1